MERVCGHVGALWSSKGVSCGCCKGKESLGGFEGRNNELQEELSKRGSKNMEIYVEKILELTER